MSDEMTLRKTVIIRAPKSKVWDALVNPDMTKQYMFGCVPVTTWEPDSPLIWRGAADGKDYVTGKVLRYEPDTVLAFTTFDPNGGMDDVPDNHLTGEYVLAYENGVTTVSVTQGDFARVADGQKRYNDSQGAWDMSLSTLKKILEH